MSESRRRRRAMEKMLGLKKPKNFFSKEASDLRARRIAAGDEIHRQNLERQKNSRLRKNTVEYKDTETQGISLGTEEMDDSTISLETNPYGFLENNEESGVSLGGK